MNGWSRGSLLLIGLAFLVPRLAHAQEAAEVTCKDGTKSHAGKGACSGHGGVDKTASATPSKSSASQASTEKTEATSKSKSSGATAATAAAPASAAAAVVTCKDGTTSHGGQGACSGHGGVDKTASTAAGTSSPKKATRSPTSWGDTSSSATAPAASAAAPAGAAVPASAAATEVICKDGTTSKGGKGACSGHHGVDESATASPHGGASAPAATSGAGGSGAPPAASAPARTAAPAAAAAAPAPTTPSSHAAATGQKGPPTAKCKDGSLSYAQHHSGACSDHGGVAQWLDETQK